MVEAQENDHSGLRLQQRHRKIITASEQTQDIVYDRKGKCYIWQWMREAAEIWDTNYRRHRDTIRLIPKKQI